MDRFVMLGYQQLANLIHECSYLLHRKWPWLSSPLMLSACICMSRPLDWLKHSIDHRIMPRKVGNETNGRSGSVNGTISSNTVTGLGDNNFTINL